MSHAFKVGDRVIDSDGDEGAIVAIIATPSGAPRVVYTLSRLPERAFVRRPQDLRPAPPKPAPDPALDAIVAAADTYIHGSRCKDTATEAARAFAAAILDEADRRAAARDAALMEPVEICDAMAARFDAVGSSWIADLYRAEAAKIRAKQPPTW